MATNPVYEKILATMPDGLERSLMNVLQHHVGNDKRISRAMLVRMIFNRPWSANCTEDRQIREAISSLQKTVPVLSDSGKGGYYLASSADEIKLYAEEIVSRARELEEKARWLRSLAERMFTEQPSLF